MAIRRVLQDGQLTTGIAKPEHFSVNFFVGVTRMNPFLGENLSAIVFSMWVMLK